MAYTVMEKLDQMTPWHSLRSYETEQEAKWQAYKWEKQRGEAKYPQYMVARS